MRAFEKIKSLKRGLGTFAVMCMVSSCALYAREATGIVPLDGQAIFKGIFFTDGDFVKKIPELQALAKVKESLTAKDRAQFVAVENKVIADIHKGNPAYFAKFEKVIKSKNRVAIQNELITGAQLLKKSIEKTTSISIDQKFVDKANQFSKNEKVHKDFSKIDIVDLRKKGKQSFPTGSVPDRVGPLACVAVVVVVAVAAVVVVVALWRPADAGRFDFASDITREKLVNSIVLAF